jgi:hypothetical protein
VGNTLTVVGGLGQIDTELTVSTVDGSGGITGITISNAGQYSEIPTNPVSVTGGAGSAATFDLTFDNPYKFWVHEVGTDEIDGLTLNPIQSFFETADLSMPVSSGINKAMQVLMLEPDFVQSGDMTVQVMGRANARAPEVNGIVMTFVEDPQTPQEQVVFLKTQRRELRFRLRATPSAATIKWASCLRTSSPATARHWDDRPAQHDLARLGLFGYTVGQRRVVVRDTSRRNRVARLGDGAVACLSIYATNYSRSVSVL